MKKVLLMMSIMLVYSGLCLSNVSDGNAAETIELKMGGA